VIRRALALAAVVLASSGCGYRLAAAGRPLAGGVTEVGVPPFENRTADAEAGALLAAGVRDELARRGVVSASEEGGARLEGVVESSQATPSSADGRGAASWRLALRATARLVKDGAALADASVVREEEFLSGQDALETEGRRRLALRRAAATAARDLVERLEAR
jgi:hypothetical protein